MPEGGKVQLGVKLDARLQLANTKQARPPERSGKICITRVDAITSNTNRRFELNRWSFRVRVDVRRMMSGYEKGEGIAIFVQSIISAQQWRIAGLSIGRI